MHGSSPVSGGLLSVLSTSLVGVRAAMRIVDAPTKTTVPTLRSARVGGGRLSLRQLATSSCAELMVGRIVPNEGSQFGLCLLPAKSLDGVFGGGGEEVDEVAVGVTKEDRAVSPGHECWLLRPLADDRLEALVLSIDIVDTHSVMAVWLSAGRAALLKSAAVLVWPRARVHDG